MEAVVLKESERLGPTNGHIVVIFESGLVLFQRICPPISYFDGGSTVVAVLVSLKERVVGGMWYQWPHFLSIVAHHPMGGVGWFENWRHVGMAKWENR